MQHQLYIRCYTYISGLFCNMFAVNHKYYRSNEVATFIKLMHVHYNVFPFEHPTDLSKMAINVTMKMKQDQHFCMVKTPPIVKPIRNV